MFDEKKLIASLEQARSEHEIRSRQVIPVRMKVGLEGFACKEDTFEIAPELVLRRAPLEERVAFYSRSISPTQIEFKAKENEFLADLDFNIPRGSVQGLAPGDGINLVSIFLNIFASRPLNVNKGNFYIYSGGELKSAGFYTCPDEYRFPSKVNFKKKDLEDLKMLWPLFKHQFETNFVFSLLARRFYQSILRLRIEDRIIDLMIALEALLVPETSGSKGDKIAKRLAQMLQPEFEYSTVHSLSETAYRIRNKIIHGGDASLAGAFDINSMSKFCQAAIQEYLIHFNGLSKQKLVKAIKTKTHRKKRKSSSPSK